MPEIREYYAVVEATHAKLQSSTEFTAEEKEKVKPLAYGHMAEGDVSISFAVRGGEDSLPLVEKVNKVFDPFLVDFIA